MLIFDVTNEESFANIPNLIKGVEQVIPFNILTFIIHTALQVCLYITNFVVLLSCKSTITSTVFRFQVDLCTFLNYFEDVFWQKILIPTKQIICLRNRCFHSRVTYLDN